MPKTLVLNQLDIFYISFDEPNREAFWAKLLNIAPWAKRVHGVKGFDAAHKKCAQESESEYFITVDGDNIIDPTFLDQAITLPDEYVDCVLSWASVNEINGLVYGNGGLKIWPKAETLVMNTHENAKEARLSLDFCWDDKYIQMNNVYSSTHPKGSPFQAFRSGFREGCKMTVHSGANVDPTKFADTLHQKNLKRLLVWMSVGADVPNGLWAIYGARLGLIKSNLDPAFDITNIRDYEWFKVFFDNEILPTIRNDDELLAKISDAGKQIVQATGLKLTLLSPSDCEFFKYVYESPKRTHALRTEISVDSEGK